MECKLKSLILCFVLLLSVSVYGQEDQKLTISGKLADQEGEPVTAARVYTIGVEEVLSDDEGFFSIEVFPGEAVVIESKEYATRILDNPAELNGQTIELIKLPFQMRETDQV